MSQTLTATEAPREMSRGPYYCWITIPVTFRGPLQVASGDRLNPVADIVVLRAPDGQAWLPGSSVRGALRDFAEREAPLIGVSAAAVRRLFGATETRQSPDDRQGRLTVFDATLHAPKSGVRDHVKHDPRHGAAAKAGKFDDEALYVGTGELVLQYDGMSQDDEELRLLRHITKGIDHGYVSLGAKKAWGYGGLKVSQPIGWCVSDRSDTGNLAMYLASRILRQPLPTPPPPPAPVVVVGGGKPDSDHLPYHWMTIDMTLQFDGPFIVAGPLSDHSHAFERDADTVAYKDPLGCYGLPGSSWRGVLRAQASRIAAELGLEAEVRHLFGYVDPKSGPAPDQKADARAGLLRVDDGVLIGDARVILMDHVAIDRVTGFAVDEKLFSVAALQSPRFASRLVVRWHPDHPDHPDHARAVALLLFTLRDATASLMWAGSRTTRGYGHLKSVKLTSVTTWTIDTTKPDAWTRPDAPTTDVVTNMNDLAKLPAVTKLIMTNWGEKLAPKGAV